MVIKNNPFLLRLLHLDRCRAAMIIAHKTNRAKKKSESETQERSRYVDCVAVADDDFVPFSKGVRVMRVRS